MCHLQAKHVLVYNSVLAQGFEYIPDVSRATNGAYVELYGVLRNLFGLRITAVCIKHFAPVTYIQIQFCNKSIYNYPAYMYII